MGDQYKRNMKKVLGKGGVTSATNAGDLLRQTDATSATSGNYTGTNGINVVRNGGGTLDISGDGVFANIYGNFQGTNGLETASDGTNLEISGDGVFANISGSYVGRDEIGVVRKGANLEVNFNPSTLASGAAAALLGNIPTAATSGQSVEWARVTINGAAAFIPIWR